MNDVYITLPRLRCNEGSAFTATANVRSGKAAATPASARYRIDCLTTGVTVKDWTSLTPASSMSITITSTDNAIQNDVDDYETKRLIVEVDTGTSATRDEARYVVTNSRGV